MDEEAGENFEQSDEDFLAARIDNISVSNLGFIVFLKASGDDRVLPIFIGANEAQSIAIAYNNQVPPRPLTHDLMKNVLGMLDVEVTKVQVTSLTENTFYGRIFFKREGFEDLDIDARPSDAIALALRYQAPIFVHKDVYESAAIVVKEGAEGEAETEPGLAETEVGPGTGAVEASTERTVRAKARPEAETHISQMERLKEKLRKALAAEHYEEAAQIRDELKRFESGN
jgi:bifunctional DNase/RNase